MQAPQGQTAWNYEEIRLPPLSSADEIAEFFERLMVELDINPALNRAIVVSRVGHETAWTGRQERLDIVRRLLEEVTGNLDPEEACARRSSPTYAPATTRRRRRSAAPQPAPQRSDRHDRC